MKLKDFRSPIYLVLGCALLLALGAAMSLDAGITFSIASGFYDDPISLEIVSKIKCAKIYYTTDGSVPDETDTLYEGAITLTDVTDQPNRLSAVADVAYEAYIPTENVMKANVIRAVAVTPWGSRSEVLSGTFFIGYDREKTFPNVPVISLMMEYDDLFDYETGIYVKGKTFDEWLEQNGPDFEGWMVKGNFSNSGPEWERPVTVEYFPWDGDDAFVQDMDVRIKGAASRTNPQKSMRLIARENYGSGTIEYPLFPENERLDGKGYIQEYASVTLRNGGNDAEYTRIRDPLIQKLASGMRIATQATAPCVVFLNGEYWGQYTMTENYGASFIENNCGIDSENVISVKNYEIADGKEEDMAAFNKMAEFIVKEDMTVEANYERAADMLDMESLADYCAIQLYVVNRDCLLEGKNWRMWSVRIPGTDGVYDDGKWRMMLFDTEYSSALYWKTEDYEYDNVSPALVDEQVKELLKSGEMDEIYEGYCNDPWCLMSSLWENDNFRRELLLSLCDVRNIYFEKDRVDAYINALRETYEPLLEDHFKRFGPEFAVADIDSHISAQYGMLEDFFQKRYDAFPGIVQNALDLSDPVSVTVRTSGAGKGAVMLGHSVLDVSKDFTGLYFPECTVTLTAQPDEGSTFAGWECSGGAIENPAAPSIEVPLECDIELTAIFE